jgi:hypothetical protein
MKQHPMQEKKAINDVRTAEGKNRTGIITLNVKLKTIQDLKLTFRTGDEDLKKESDAKIAVLI